MLGLDSRILDSDSRILDSCASVRLLLLKIRCKLDKITSHRNLFWAELIDHVIKQSWLSLLSAIQTALALLSHNSWLFLHDVMQCFYYEYCSSSALF